MSLNKSLYLVDAYALIFRAYYAFLKNPMYNTEGLNTSTIFGFTNTIEELLNKENPTHMAVVFDPPGGTFRNKIYPLYKANRSATPEEIKKSVPLIKDLLAAYNIEILQIDDYEADDVIGTIAKRAAGEGYMVYMVTPDKDYIQLLDKNIRIYKPAKNGSNPEILTTDNIREYYDVNSPEQFLELLSLMGDSADNIPGAPGIGEKTAAKLLLEYGNIETLFNSTDKLKGKVQEIIINNQDLIKLSKQLCTIVSDIPIELDLNNLSIRTPNMTMVKTLFGKFNFSTLEKRVLNRLNKTPVTQGTLFDTQSIVIDENTQLFKTIINTKHDYYVIESIDDLKALINKYNQYSQFSFHVDSSLIDASNFQINGFSLSWELNSGFYIPYPLDFEIQNQYIIILRTLFQNKDVRKIGHDIKYEILVLRQLGIEIQGDLFDVMVAHYLLEPEQRHNLNFLAEKYLKYSPDSQNRIVKDKRKSNGEIQTLTIKQIVDLNVEITDIILQLDKILNDELKKCELEQLSNLIEMPLIKVIAEMEFEGIKLNKDVLNNYAKILNNDLNKIENKIIEIAGIQFNIQSPKQLGEVLFEKLEIAGAKKTGKTKQYSTSEDILLDLVDKHPIVPLILEYRTLRKLLNTYVEVLPQMVNPRTGRLHTTFNQALTATGRLSSVDPNLQNIPIRNERGREIRKAFVPGSESSTILSADYSQIELRIMAHMSKDHSMIAAFLNNEDIHQTTASKIFNVPIEEVTREMRNSAKTANFGIIYGISAFGLAQRLKIGRKDANNIIEEYFKKFPGVKNYMENSVQEARSKGFVSTLFKRRRFLPDINSSNGNLRSMAERNAINSPIQGTAADIIKLAMVNLQNQIKFRGLRSRMILQVHDELLFDVVEDEIDQMKILVKDEMENVLKLSVPLLVEVGTGNNWYEAH